MITLVSSGLSKVGFNYINMDDCWQYSRDSKGNIQPDPRTFPNGVKHLADMAHSLGLRFGLYSSAGTNTCQGRPGSLGYEVQDANSYASWGVDYLKYDNCYNKGIPPEKRYPTMRDALNQTGRAMFYSLCEWGDDNPALWAPKVGNSWRTTNDISDKWQSMLRNLDQNDKWWSYAGPGAWNDPDMLEVGNGGMKRHEYVAHFSLWALVKSPLLIGCDITQMSKETKEILFNTEVIAVNQDKLGSQGHKVSSQNGLEVWAGRLSGGKYSIVLLNRSEQRGKITALWSDIGIHNNAKFIVRDLWRHYDMGTYSGKFEADVESHGVIMVTLVPA